MKSERFIAYKKEVVAVFLKKSAEARESWLVELNRGRVRQRSIELIEKGVQSSDYRAVSDFLKMKADDHDFLSAVNATDQDDFQGLFLFLKTPTKNPSATTVEFLSWMIDFPKRPFSEYIKTDTHLKLEAIGDPLPPGRGEQEQPVVETSKPSNRRQVDPLYLWISWPIFLFLFAGLIWWFRPNNDCMYWNDYHYIESSCNAPKLDKPLVVLDRAKLRGFRRIKKIDSLTTYAVGRFWYARVAKDSLEIFTASGVHPLYPEKELKKVTDYIVIICNPDYQRN